MAGRFGDAGEAMLAISRLLGQGGEALVREARGLFRADAAQLLEVLELEGRLEPVAADPPLEGDPGLLPIVEQPALARAIDTGQPVQSEGELVLPLGPRRLLVLADRRPYDAAELRLAAAFAAAAAAGLAQVQLAAGQAEQTDRQAALARAARTLNETLDLNQVLVKICEEAASLLGAEVAAVYTGDGRAGLRVEAALGLPPEAIGSQLDPGEGLAGQVAVKGRSLVTNGQDMQGDLRSALAVPMHWEGRLRGVLAAGFERTQLVTPEQVGLLETFAEIAAAACRNASAHAGLAVAARTDSLTGCLNHAAMHDALRAEIERHRRGGGRLALAIVDLDDFKQVNEIHGHQAGDRLLRDVGGALREGVRAYDSVARYGGDEFAIVAGDAGELEATELAERALARVRAVHARATAGVAEWEEGEGAAELIERADRALRFAKHRGERGSAQRAALVPEDFEPAASPRAALRRP